MPIRTGVPDEFKRYDVVAGFEWHRAPEDMEEALGVISSSPFCRALYRRVGVKEGEVAWLLAPLVGPTYYPGHTGSSVI